MFYVCKNILILYEVYIYNCFIKKIFSNYYEIKTNNLTNICIMNSFKTIN